MDKPIHYANGKDCHTAIAESFVEFFENATDTKLYISREAEGAAAMLRNTLFADSARSSTIMYFDRFLDIYSYELGDSMEDYRSQVRCRTRKDAIAKEFYDIKHKVDYTDELIDLARATREQAYGTDRLARITAAFAGVSMVVAIVTILLAVL